VEFADPIFVAQLGYPLTIPGLLEFVDVPGKICRRDLHLPSCEVDMGKTLELRVLVRRDVNGLTVLVSIWSVLGSDGFITHRSVSWLLRRNIGTGTYLGQIQR